MTLEIENDRIIIQSPKYNLDLNLLFLMYALQSLDELQDRSYQIFLKYMFV